jgi:hypothetical protein
MNQTQKLTTTLMGLAIGFLLLTNQAWAVPFTILGSGGDFGTGNSIGSAIAVDPVNGYLYAAGGASTTGSGDALIRIDVSNAAAIGAPFTLSTQYVTGVAVNPTNGRVAAVDPQGVFTSTLGVFSSAGTLIDTELLTGCPAFITEGIGTFGISTQCNDRFHIYNEASMSLPFTSGPQAVGSTAIYNGATGKYYHNRTPGATIEHHETTFATASLPPEGSGDVQMIEANSVTNRLYGVSDAGNFVILDGNNATAGAPAALVTISGLSMGDLAVDTTRNLLYIHDASTGNIDFRNGSTGAFVDAHNLGGGWTPRLMEMTDGSNLLYVTASNSSMPGINRVFVAQIPEPSSLLLAGLGLILTLGYAGWKRRKNRQNT